MAAGSALPSPPDPVVGAAVCIALRRQAEKLGLSLDGEPVWEAARFTEQQDPYSGETSWVGIWKGGARYGTVTLFPDGRVFAEYQVLLPCPAQPDTYVEAVQVWGSPTALRGEAVIRDFPE